MKYIATLVGNRFERGLSESVVAQAHADWQGGNISWLAPGLAAAFPVAEKTGVDAFARAHRIDAAILPAAHQRKRLLVADMDSTIIGCECIDEIADFAGVKSEIAGITERAMRGELVFEDALRQRVALLKGFPVEKLARVFAERVRINPGAATLVRTMAAHGAVTALVSGGFTFFTSRVANDAGFQLNFANVLLDDGAGLTGKVQEPILGREAKRATLMSLAQGHGIALVDTLALGDGANDLAMIEAAGLGIAYKAKPVLEEKAAAAIRFTDLTAALYFQGYRAGEFAAV